MKDAAAILRFLLDAATRGERTALVTLTDTTASASRSPGEHMAVAGDGSFAGSFSGGCIEAAIVAEAIDMIASSTLQRVRYGAGSPYIDIRLPCGGAIDLLIAPAPDPAAVRTALTLIERREPVAIDIASAGMVAARRAMPDERTGWIADAFVARHDPRLRLVIMGHGAEPAALIRIAGAYGAETELWSPEPALVADVAAGGGAASLLRIQGAQIDIALDAWTAVVMLFHDHDWEADLLVQMLARLPAYIGAMGSRATHATRCRQLAALGVDRAAIDRIRAPIGLIPGARDPDTLAISIMAQIVDDLRGAA